MAPEQWTRKNVDKYVDLYALGIITYELITGQYPFPYVPGSTDWRKNHENVTPYLLNQYWPDAPPDLSQVILKALNKAPTDRYESVSLFSTALKRAIDNYPELIPSINEVQNQHVGNDARDSYKAF